MFKKVTFFLIAFAIINFKADASIKNKRTSTDELAEKLVTGKPIIENWLSCLRKIAGDNPESKKLLHFFDTKTAAATWPESYSQRVKILALSDKDKDRSPYKDAFIILKDFIHPPVIIINNIGKPSDLAKGIALCYIGEYVMNIRSDDTILQSLAWIVHSAEFIFSRLSIVLGKEYEELIQRYMADIRAVDIGQISDEIARDLHKLWGPGSEAEKIFRLTLFRMQVRFRLIDEHPLDIRFNEKVEFLRKSNDQKDEDEDKETQS